MSAKLIIDMDRIKPQGQSSIRCSYKHHPENKGFDAVLEMVRFSLICRRCQSAPCVAACPHKALEKVPNAADGRGILQRAHMLCTGCGTCALACPFGTVYDDLMPFASSVCDLCKDRLGADEMPLCVRTCEGGEVEYRQAEPGGDLVAITESILAKVTEGSIWRPFLREIPEARK